MTTDNSTLMGAIALVAAAVVILVVAIVAVRQRAMRSAELRERFGPEYERAVEQLGGRRRAESELAARARRVDHIGFRDLNAEDRARFQAGWREVQGRFVDDPAASATQADELIKDLMRARGYPADDFEHRVADLSVDHADVVQHYRAAQALSGSLHEGQSDTEELRQALVHYRALFADLLQGGAREQLHRAHV